MSTAFRSPSSMKDTGLSWIPNIPSHWDVKRAKLILREVDSRSANGDEVLLSVSQYTGVTPRRTRDNSDEQDTRSERLVGYKKVAAGDLVVNIMLAWNGSLGASKFDGVVSPAYCVYRFEGDNQPDYYHHLLRTDAYNGRIKVDSRGVVDSRLRLYSENLFRVELPVPPPDEQAQIVRFIRHLDQRVNRLIKTKRRLIELLNEQKQAIIHRAVTRGLDPTVPLKPSGIDWLGDVPEHWTIRKVSRTFRTTGSGTTPSTGNRTYYDEG
ncbi:MAG: restriction endonuclease subunit S, partial [Armatimonadota bacterium]